MIDKKGKIVNNGYVKWIYETELPIWQNMEILGGKKNEKNS